MEGLGWPNTSHDPRDNANSSRGSKIFSLHEARRFHLNRIHMDLQRRRAKWHGEVQRCIWKVHHAAATFWDESNKLKASQQVPYKTTHSGNSRIAFGNSLFWGLFLPEFWTCSQFSRIFGVSRAFKSAFFQFEASQVFKAISTSFFPQFIINSLKIYCFFTFFFYFFYFFLSLFYNIY